MPQIVKFSLSDIDQPPPQMPAGAEPVLYGDEARRKTVMEQFQKDMASGQPLATTWPPGASGKLPAPGPEKPLAIHAPTGNEPVLLDDLKEDPVAAMKRIGAFLGRDLTDKRTWLMAAAAYFGPKVFNVVAPVVARAVGTAGRLTGQAAGGALGLADPDLVSIASPRAGAALRKYQQIRDAFAARAATSAPDSAAPAAAPASPVAAQTGTTPPPSSPATLSASGPPAPLPVVNPPGAAPAPSPARATPPGKLTLTTEEYLAGQKLIAQGHDPADVLKAIQRNKLPASWLNLPGQEEVDAAIADRNATGRWPQDRR